MAEYPLGRLIQHDPRSLNFPAEKAVGPTKVWRHHGSILNQTLQGRNGQGLGSCTGNAMTGCLKTEPYYRLGQRLTNATAIKLYSAATELDEFDGTYPPTDTGSSSLGVAKAAQKLGYITSYTHAFGIDHATAASVLGPFIVGTYWYEAMFQPDKQGLVAPAGAKAGGHEYLCLGKDPGSQLWAFCNSWSVKWGVPITAGHLGGGGFWMTNRDFAELLDDGGDVLVPVL